MSEGEEADVEGDAAEMKIVRIALAAAAVALLIDLAAWFVSGNSILFFQVFRGRWLNVGGVLWG